MAHRWNSENLKRQYEWVKETAIKQGFNADDLDPPYLDKLSHKTKSKRIFSFIKLAYFLGWLRGIAYVDGGLTPVTLDK